MLDEAWLDRLSGELRPVRVRRAGREAGLLALLCLAELAFALWFGMMRPDMAAAMTQPSFWWKLASLGVIACGGAAVSIVSFDPATSPGSGTRWLAILVGACLIGGALVDMLDTSWPRTEGARGLAVRLHWHSGVLCVAKMMALSLPPLLGLGSLMRRGAASQPGATSFAVGLTASAWGAFVFVFACPFDDPLYISVWYGVGCGLVTASARFLLPVLTRW